MNGRPDSIGPFRVKRTLNTTKASTTYLTVDKRDDCAATVTTLHLNVSQRPHAYRQFNRLARELQKLQHPAVLPIIDFGDALSQPYVAIPYVAGHTIRDQIEVRPLTVAETLAVLEVVIPPLEIAHRLRLYHRDILPHQIACTPDSQLVWRNFGVATLFECFHSRQAAFPYGSSANMAPELIQGGRTSAHTDIYQLGVTVFQMLTGWLPFTGPNHELLRCHLEMSPPAAKTLVPTLPAAVDAAVKRALAKNPRDRHASVTAFLNALQ